MRGNLTDARASYLGCIQIISSVNQKDKDRGEETLELSGGTDRKEQTKYGRVISGLVPVITNIHCFGPSGRTQCVI